MFVSALVTVLTDAAAALLAVAGVAKLRTPASSLWACVALAVTPSLRPRVVSS